MGGFVAHNGLRSPAELQGLQRTADAYVDAIDQLPEILGQEVLRRSPHP